MTGTVLRCRPHAGPVRVAIRTGTDQVEGFHALGEFGRGVVLEQNERRAVPADQVGPVALGRFSDGVSDAGLGDNGHVARRIRRSHPDAQMRNAFPGQAPPRMPPGRLISHQLAERRQVARGGGCQGSHHSVLPGTLSPYRADSAFPGRQPVQQAGARGMTQLPGNETTGVAMDSTGHHREAENLLNKWSENRSDLGRAPQFMPWLAAAQVHATLALAAATMASLEYQQQAARAASQPSPSAGAGRPVVAEKESTLEWIMQPHAQPNPQPDSAPAEPPPIIEIVMDEPDTPDQPPPGPAR
jgi:hypothetical protein